MKYLFLLLAMVVAVSGQGQEMALDTATGTPLHPKLEIYNLLRAGDDFKNKGNLIEAERNYLAAVRIAEPLIAKGTSHRIMIDGLTIFDPIDRLGYLYLLSNNPKKATIYFQESLHLRETHLPRSSIYRAQPLVGLAEVAMKEHQDQQALLLVEQAESIQDHAMTSFYSGEALYKNILFIKAALLFRTKEYKKLKKVIDKLFSGGSVMSLQTNNEARSQVPRVFELQARYFLETGDLDQAANYLLKARKFSNAFSTTLVDFDIQRTEALMLWARNDIPAAGQKLFGLTSLYKDFVVRNFSSMSDHEKENFFAQLKEDFDLLNAFIIDQRTHSKSPVFFGWAYDNQLFSKALLLNETNKIKKQIEEGDDEELKHTLHSWEESKGLLSSLYYEKDRDAVQIARLESTIEVLERSLNEHSSLLKGYSQFIHWTDVRQTLKSDEAAGEIIRVRQFSVTDPVMKFRFTDSVFYMILTIDRNSTDPSCTRIARGTLLETRNLNYYRNCITGRISDTLSYAAFWRPIKSSLPDVKRIYLSPDGVYNQINLDILQNPESHAYLLQEVSLVMVTNTKDLLTMAVPATTRRASLYGRPAYKLSELLTKQNEADRSVSVREIRSEQLDDFRDQSFSDLPGTQDEINRVETLLSDHQWSVQHYSGDRASETNLKAEQGPPVLHIATHGFFLPQREGQDINSMIRSGIILAGVNNQQTDSGFKDDGILTAYESTNLNLAGTELVILSACETGLGETKNGVGVYGLQRGFTVAGARHLLMSLWKVDDTSTDLLMQQFYSAWVGGEEVHQALRSAQLEIMKTYPHPYYWGAFVLLGK